MICLRCGLCCIYLNVTIVNPISIRPDGTIDPDKRDAVVFKPAGQKCPHLVYQEDKAVCTIHHLACYHGTSCEQFEQLGPDDSICIMNGYFKTL
jgi:hypothetical protein